MILVLAVEAGERWGAVMGSGSSDGLVRGEGREMRACRCAGLVGAVGTVAVVVVDAGEGDGDGWGGYTGEGISEECEDVER